MSGKFHSADKVRCPQCHKTWDPRSGDPFHNGENGFICPACECEFTVIVELLPEFTSPESDTSPYRRQGDASETEQIRCIHGGVFPCRQCEANRRGNEAATGKKLTADQFREQYAPSAGESEGGRTRQGLVRTQECMKC